MVTYAQRGRASRSSTGADAQLQCRSLILATGSASHDLAASLGHTIAPLIPSLFSFRLRAGGMLDGSLAGVSVPDVQLTLVPPSPPPAAQARGEGAAGGKRRRRRSRAAGSVASRGPLLITHRGLSGPAALKLSAFAAEQLAACSYSGLLELNLVPSLSRAEVGAALQAFRGREPAKAVQTANPFGLPRRLWSAVVVGRPPDAAAGRASGAGAETRSVDPSTRWDALRSEHLHAIEERVCRAPLLFDGKDSNKDEFVTAGGVCWKGVDAKRMESRIVGRLFFAGELLDVDGITGGHNFQSCWTTGFIAGNAAAEL